MVNQGSEITVQATNEGEIDTTVHWHGLRLREPLRRRAQGNPGPDPDGESYTYRVEFPDPGFYWYHPHIREDFAQEMGLYGSDHRRAIDPTYWPPADRQLTITLDDMLIEDGKMRPSIAPGRRSRRWAGSATSC